MKLDQKLTFGNFLRSFKYPIKGIVYFFKNERNAKVHLIIATMVITFSFLLGINHIEWAITSLALSNIFIQEISNSAKEDIVDLICSEINEKAGLAKDKSAGSVLMAGISLAVVELIILGPKILLVLGI